MVSNNACGIEIIELSFEPCLKVGKFGQTGETEVASRHAKDRGSVVNIPGLSDLEEIL